MAIADKLCDVCDEYVPYDANKGKRFAMCNVCDTCLKDRPLAGMRYSEFTINKDCYLRRDKTSNKKEYGTFRIDDKFVIKSIRSWRIEGYEPHYGIVYPSRFYVTYIDKLGEEKCLFSRDIRKLKRLLRKLGVCGDVKNIDAIKQTV